MERVKVSENGRYKDSPEIPIRQKTYYHEAEAGSEKKVFAW